MAKSTFDGASIGEQNVSDGASIGASMNVRQRNQNTHTHTNKKVRLQRKRLGRCQIMQVVTVEEKGENKDTKVPSQRVGMLPTARA